MADPRPEDASPPATGGDGVRITPLPPRSRGGVRHVVLGLGVLGLLGALAFVVRHDEGAAPPIAAVATSAVPTTSPASSQTPSAASSPGLRWVPAVADDAHRLPMPTRSSDPNDLANYVRPGDPVPSGAAVIKALQQSGIHTGLGAFNPPGTMPLLSGLAVPPDFPLPDGYVRHHQVTDEGEPIEPILMFAPDAVLRDSAGRAIPLPVDRIVPPELAPPGLPLRWVRPGPP